MTSMANSMLANRGAVATARLPAKRPTGYSTIEQIAAAPREDGAWTSFVRDVMGMPDWMLPAVQYAVRQKVWMQALDPIQTLRKGAELKAARMELGPEAMGN